MIHVNGSAILNKDAEVKANIGSGLTEMNLMVVKEFASGKKFTHYFSAKAWGDVTKGLILTKGAEVQFEGELSQESWKDKTTGKNQYKTVITITKLSAIGEPPKQEETATTTEDCPF